MAAKLQEMLDLLEGMRRPKPSKTTRTRSLAKALLGSCKGLVPRGKTSTRWIRDLRASLYGKVR